MLVVTEGITEAHLQDVYSDTYITKVGHAHRPAAPIHHPLVTYLTATVAGNFSGAFMAIRHTPVDLELHALLKKSALPHSRQLAREFLRWAFAQPIIRVTAHIIEGLEMAKNFCLKLGFRIEGTRRNACVQNGIAKDVYILGMLREEWEAMK